MPSKTYTDNTGSIDSDWLNPVNNWTYGPATKTIAKTLTPEDGVKIYPQGSDGGVFIGVTGLAPGTLADNGGTYYGSEFIPTGGDGSAGWRRPHGPMILASWFGVLGDGAQRDDLLTQAAIDSLPLGLGGGGGIVKMPYASTFKFDGEVEIPANVTLDCSNSIINQTVTGRCVTLGTSDTVLSPFPGFINFRIKQQEKTSVGVTLRGTDSARVQGYIEGYTAVIDNTRTNIGVHVDGRDVSAFSNYIDVKCNHVHECFRINTTGTVQPTSQFFINCTAFGDQLSDDTSIGYNFADTAVAGLGDGTKIIGGNIEFVNMGIYFGQNSRNIDVDSRWEINNTATSRKVKFHATTDGINLRGAGIDSAIIGAVAGGIEGFSNGAHTILDRNGNYRLGGNDSSFAGITPPILAVGGDTMLLPKNTEYAIRTRDDDTGTGYISLQPGGGSNAHGAYLRLNGNANATNPKDLQLGPSTGGKFSVTNGLGQAVHMQVQNDAIAGNTALLLWDVDNATLERVSVGAADSGGAGFKVLRIPN